MSKQDLFEILFINYASMMLISTILSGAIFAISKHPIAKIAFFYWLSILFGGFTQGFAQNDPFNAALAMLCSTPSSFLLLRLIEEIFQVKILKKAYVAFWLSSTAFGFTMWFLGFSFPWYSFFFTLSVALPVSINLFRSFPKINKEEISRYLFWFTCTIWISFLYTYPWLRINQDYSLHALLASFWIGFFAAISLPLMLLDQIKSANAKILEQKIKETSSDLILKNTELLNSERTKTNLLRILCHDIANLISVAEFSARGILKIYDPFLSQTTTLDAQQLHSLKTCKKRLFHSIETQTELVNNIRSYLALTQGKMQITANYINLSSAIEKSLELNQLKADQKHIKFKYDFNDKQLEVYADFNSLVNSVFSNILSNAIKFSYEHNSVVIEVQPINSNFAAVIFRDFGIGISKDKIKDIFLENQSTSSSGTMGESGTGFGMPIVKYVCDQIGAEVNIFSIHKDESLSNHGTEIRVILKSRK